MLACLDVDYRDDATVAGCMLFRSWADDRATGQMVVFQGTAAPYRPGEFYLRELPPLLAVLAQVSVQLEIIVIDGFVWLGGSRPGLGARLYSVLGSKTPVIGVAKNPWRSGMDEQSANSPERRTIAVARGGSKRPLYVTSAGMDVASAAKLISAMHGRFRIPTLLAAVNRLVRSSRKPG